MKKFVFTLLLVLGCQISLAQNSAALFDEFRREKNAEYVSASPFLMFIGKMFYPYNDEGKEIASKIRSAKILDLDEVLTGRKATLFHDNSRHCPTTATKR